MRAPIQITNWPLSLTRATGFYKVNTYQVSSHGPHMYNLTGSPPQCLSLLQREVQSRCETIIHHPFLFSDTYRAGARRYASLHFHACIQGHFLNKSIEQSEYTIFVSLCILELKYIEGNKNNKA